MRRLEDLEVYRRSLDLAESVYRFTEHYPPDEVRRLTDQTCRSALSVPANIAEGWGRGTPGQFRYFLRVAIGSACELECHLHLAVRLGYATRSDAAALLRELLRIRRMIDGLVASLSPRDGRPDRFGRITPRNSSDMKATHRMLRTHETSLPDPEPNSPRATSRKG